MLKISKSAMFLLYNLKPVKGPVWRCCSQICAIIAIAAFILSARSAQSATYQLPDCQQTTVQSYVNSARDRDVLICPAGSWTWTTTTSNTPSVLINKAITLVGAGFDVVNNVATSQTTTIIDGTNSEYVPAGNTHANNEVAIQVNVVAGKVTRIAGFSFGIVSGYGDSMGVVKINGTTPFQKNFRIDHCKGTSLSGGDFFNIYNSVYGVIDHCNFENKYPGNTITVHGNSNSHAADTSTSAFVQPNPAGTDNAVYIEDCTFVSPGPKYGAGDFDCDGGGHMVIRYNSFTDAGIQLHDTAYTGGRGCRHYEVYNNTFTTTQGIAWAFAGRSGTGVIHDNIITGNWAGPPFALSNYRSADTSNGEDITKWGFCDGTYSCDGNDPAYHPASNGTVPSGYPCIDQPGRITDINWNGATCYGNTGNAGPAQPLDPVYAWNNKWNSGSYNSVITVRSGCKTNVNGVSICVSDHIQANRDYYDNVMAKPNYKAFKYPHPLADPSVPKLGTQ